jgi:long-chain acyl-CoA synthetase
MAMRHDFLEAFRGTHFKGQWPTVVEMFRITVERYGDRNAFTAFLPQKSTWTYRELSDKVSAAARWLSGSGISKGDKVGITGKNTPEWALAYLSILSAGGIVVPLDYQLKNEDISALFAKAGVKTAFIDEEKYDYFTQAGGKGLKVVSLSPAKPAYILSLDAEPSAGSGIELPMESDLAVILFTSGTTGVAKGVMLSHANLVSDAYLSQNNMAIFHTDIFYALLPLHHSYSMLAVFIESLAVGAEIVFARSMAIAQILKELKEGQVTMFLGIPLLFNKIMKALLKGIREKGVLAYGLVRTLMAISGFIKKVFKINIGRKWFKGILKKISLDTNRICICGGGPLPASTFKRFNELGIDFVQGYGLTETSPIAALNPREAYRESSVGKIIPGIEARIGEPDHSGIGEIQLKGSIVMQGYFEDPQATAAIMTPDGWLKTGDMGYLDKDNYLYLTGRAKNIIVTEGGKNVYPEEIEDKFQLYDEIEQILVRGYVADAKMKVEGIEAVVYPRQEGEPVKESRLNEVIAEVNRELLPYQKITRMEILNEPMEMTTTRKIKRHTLNES